MSKKSDEPPLISDQTASKLDEADFRSDKSTTAWFGREGDFVCSVQSFFDQTPSLESIQCKSSSWLLKKNWAQ
ncbi:MAG: hypothetical protein EAZ32_11725 [Cytophagia bacterium]|nr:MAG: hypothetical protein EAZ46_06335 [Runella sp.]TAG19475.1 MAG: hypothetical protein EAZ38_12460 [Cytophagales bacterium]TAG38756.1 MAG: hypothetical protein EAZ32_11725 [Cytophagia bacterium]TAG47345.1 MAG: hypothetical protein EAZ29_14125 [Runella slithyformis]TAG80323.1 MAG: hypothetical protein EAZ22_09805 [Cytophagales bacterium]